MMMMMIKTGVKVITTMTLTHSTEEIDNDDEEDEEDDMKKIISEWKPSLS